MKYGQKDIPLLNLLLPLDEGYSNTHPINSCVVIAINHPVHVSFLKVKGSKGLVNM